MVKLEVIAQNLTRVTLPGLSVWFSYETPVAVRVEDSDALVVARNQWTTTTGKHLTMIDGGGAAARDRADHAIVLQIIESNA